MSNIHLPDKASLPQQALKRTVVMRFLANHKLLVLGTMLTVIMSTITYTAWRFYKTIYPTPNINFQEYAPNWLPPRVQVKSKLLAVTRQPAPNPAITELNIALSNYDTVRMERNDGKILPYFTYTCSALYTYKTCVLATTLKGQKFEVIADTLDRSNPNNFLYKYMQVKWLTGNTLIMYSTISHPYYSTATIGRIIDSMVPVHYKGLKTIYMGSTCPTGAACGLPNTNSLR